MATLKTKFMVGIFVVTGFTLAVVVVVWLGMSNYLEKGRYYVAYFDESVQGLDKDSPVKYRGVTIGSVYRIGVAPDAHLIQVILKIDTDLLLDERIVAQLKSVGITGIMFVELEKKEITTSLEGQRIDSYTRYPIISTKPSDIKQFFDAINDVLLEFKKIDLQGISKHIQSTLSKMEKAIDEAQIDSLVQELNQTLHALNLVVAPEKWKQLMENFDETLKSFQNLAHNSSSTVSDAGITLEQIENAISQNNKALAELMTDLSESIQHIDGLIQDGNLYLENTHKETVRLLPQLKNTLRQYEKAGKHLSRFLEQIADQPSQLFLGQPPEEPEISTK